jgi:cytoskeletal protein CcmA (bactofilin family)
MKKSKVGVIAGILALLMVLTGCEGLVTSNVDIRDDDNSTHYYVDLVPAAGIPVVEDLNNGNATETSYKLAEAFNKYDTVYYVGNSSVTVPAGKTLYVAPGSAVPSFFVASAISKGNTTRAGVSTGAGTAKIVVLEGATMPLAGPSTLGGLLQVNVGGRIDQGSSGSAAITGAGRVIVGGSVNIDSITVAGDVYVARGNGSQHGIITAVIDTTYLALPTRAPNEDGNLNSSGRSDEDFYAFETVVPETSRDVRVDGVVKGDITSGGNVYIAENSRITGLNEYYGYVNGDITTYGKAEVLGNVTGNVIAKDAVTVGSNLTPVPHRAQVGGAIYSRIGNVLIKPRANSGNIVAYRGSVTIEEGAAVTGIDTFYDNSSYSKSKYDGIDDLVNHGNVIVKGIVNSSITSSGASSYGSGDIFSGGTVVVRLYDNPKAAWSDFGPNGYVSGNVAARYSARIDGVVDGDLDTNNYAFDLEDETPAQTQNVMVNGAVFGQVSAGGALTVADHHAVDGNINPGISFSGVYANGYVGGGAEVYSQHGTGPSIINGYVEGGAFYVGSPATVTIASTGRVNTFGYGGGYNDSVQVYGTLAIEAGGELDADEIDDIYLSSGDDNGSLTDSHVFAHASGLVNGGHLGPTWSPITIAPGVKLYTKTPLAANTNPTLAEQETQFKELAASQFIHANVRPTTPSLGVHGNGALNLTVGLYNGVTLINDTSITGTITVNGMLALGGKELTLNGAGAVALDADNSPLFNYAEDGDYINGSISFAGSGSSLKFNSATAALNGLSSPSSYRPTGAPDTYNRDPVVIGVESSFYGSYTVAEFALPVTVTAVPTGDFMPGFGVVLKESSSSYTYISKTSKFVWEYTTYTP